MDNPGMIISKSDIFNKPTPTFWGTKRSLHRPKSRGSHPHHGPLTFLQAQLPTMDKFYQGWVVLQRLFHQEIGHPDGGTTISFDGMTHGPWLLCDMSSSVPSLSVTSSVSKDERFTQKSLGEWPPRLVKLWINKFLRSNHQTSFYVSGSIRVSFGGQDLNQQ